MALTIITVDLPRATRGQEYSQEINAAGGVKPYVWEIQEGTLPDGLTLTTNVNDAGVISGTPTANTPDVGNSIRVEVRDAAAAIAVTTLSLTVVDTAIGNVPSAADAQWEPFWNCVDQLGYHDNIEQLFEEWAAQFNPNISIASKAYDDLKNRKQAIDFLICVNRFLASEIATLLADLNGKANAVEQCLIDNYSPTGYRVGISLQEAIALLGSSESDLNTQYLSAVAQETAIDSLIAQVERRGTVARDLLAFVKGNNPAAYVVKYQTDRDTYENGETITFDLQTTLTTTLLNCWIPRDDGEPPFFQEITDITQINPQKFTIRVLVPADFRGGNFRVKFQSTASSGASCTFFQHFDQLRAISPGGRRRYRVRPCPPA